jgi:hypothetical protein
MFDDESYKLNLEFKPYQSLLYKLYKGTMEKINIEFVPSTPVSRKRVVGYEAPWLLK